MTPPMELAMVMMAEAEAKPASTGREMKRMMKPRLRKPIPSSSMPHRNVTDITAAAVRVTVIIKYLRIQVNKAYRRTPAQ